MIETGMLLLSGLGVLLAATFVLWLLSLALRDASIVDIWWGLGFALLAWTGYLLSGGDHPRRLLIAGLATAWGLRLGLYLLWRNAGEGEDPRYVAMRRHHGDRFPWVSLFTVFWLQGFLQWVVGLPLQLTMAAPGAAGLGSLDLIGVAVFAVGLGFETVGDLQLARFRADPANDDGVMDGGLWRYTRHPNYFGDCVAWWGIFLVALGSPLGWLTVVGPAVMTFLLLRVSGVALLERSIGKRRPAYAEYVRKTSAFIPRPPRH